MKIGLFGAGRVSWVHAENIHNHSVASLVAVYDPNTAAACELTERFGGSVAETEEKIFKDPEVEAVVIASSTNTHVELIRSAAQSGKAVFCEKPIDLDLATAKSVRDDIRRSGIPVCIGFRRRFVSELQEIHTRIQNGEIGVIESVRMAAWDASPPPLKYVEVSGGFLRDKAIHYFDLACWLTGETPVSVQASGSCLVDSGIGALGDVDTVMATLKNPSGALVHITNGRRSVSGIREQIEISGSEGSLVWDPSRSADITQSTKSGMVVSSGQQPTQYYRQETFATALDAFVQSVKTGSPVSPSYEDGLKAQAIADAATNALQTKQMIEISY